MQNVGDGVSGGKGDRAAGRTKIRVGDSRCSRVLSVDSRKEDERLGATRCAADCHRADCLEGHRDVFFARDENLVPVLVLVPQAKRCDVDLRPVSAQPDLLEHLVKELAVRDGREHDDDERVVPVRDLDADRDGRGALALVMASAQVVDLSAAAREAGRGRQCGRGGRRGGVRLACRLARGARGAVGAVAGRTEVLLVRRRG